MMTVAAAASTSSAPASGAASERTGNGSPASAEPASTASRSRAIDFGAGCHTTSRSPAIGPDRTAARTQDLWARAHASRALAPTALGVLGALGVSAGGPAFVGLADHPAQVGLPPGDGDQTRAVEGKSVYIGGIVGV